MTTTYATLAEVRDQLGDTSSRLDADLLTKAIAAASRAVDAYTQRRFWKDDAPTSRLYAPTWPGVADVDDIASTTGLAVEVDTGGDATWSQTWAAADYQLEPLNADQRDPQAYAWWRIRAVGNYTFLRSSFPGRATLRVTAVHGWSAVPDAVAQATVIKTVALFSRKDSPYGVAGFGEFGAVRISRRDPDVVELLAPYRRRPVLVG